jgi:hypothetical protein
MKALIAAAFAAMTLSACADLPNSSRVTHAQTLFDSSVFGGPDFPVIITGAEVVGVPDDVLADSLRFPARSGRGSSFRSAQHEPGMINHAHLDIFPSGENASARLTFLHGERRIGAGIFTLPVAAFSDPYAVGNISATLISSIKRRSRQLRRDNDGVIWLYN